MPVLDCLRLSCHQITILLTVHRAKLAVAVLAMCAGAVGLCVALMYGVHNQFPVYTLIDASANRTPSLPGYNATQAIGNTSSQEGSWTRVSEWRLNVPLDTI